MSASADMVMQELKARQDIHDVLVRYCRGADLCDVDIMRSCFHADAIDDHGFFNGSAHEFADKAAFNLKSQFKSTRHYITNEYVELDGDVAKSETCILCHLRFERDEGVYDVTAHCRYLDRLERRGGAWKIAHRILVSDGTRVDRVNEEFPNLNRGVPGGHNPDDPSIRFFGGVSPHR